MVDQKSEQVRQRVAIALQLGIVQMGARDVRVTGRETVISDLSPGTAEGVRQGSRNVRTGGVMGRRDARQRVITIRWLAVTSARRSSDPSGHRTTTSTVSPSSIPK